MPGALIATGSINLSGTAGTSRFWNSPLLTNIDGVSGAYTPQIGDLILVWTVSSAIVTRTTAQMAPSMGGSGTTLTAAVASALTSSDTNVLSANLYYHFVVSGEEGVSGGITMPGAPTSTSSVSAVIMCFSGIDSTTPLAGVTPTTVTAINGALPDPPSITTPAAPTGCIIAAFGGQAQSTGAALAAPTTTPLNANSIIATNNTAQTNDSAAIGGVKTGIAVSTAFNASAFTGGTTANTDSSAAMTVVLKRAPDTFSAAISASVAISATQARSRTTAVAVGRSIAVSASSAAAVTYRRAIAGAVDLFGAALNAAAHVRGVAGSVAVSGSARALAARARAICGAISVQGIVRSIAAYARTAAGSVIVQGAQQRVAAYGRAIAGAVAASAALARAATFRRTIAGAVAMTGKLSIVKAYARSIAAAVIVSSAVRNVQAYARAVTAAVAVPGFAGAQTAYRRSIAGAVKVGGSVLAGGVFVRAVSGRIAVSAATRAAAVYALVVAGSIPLFGAVAAAFRHAFITPDTRVLKLTAARLALQVTGTVVRLLQLTAGRGVLQVTGAAERLLQIEAKGDRHLDVGEE